MEQLLDCSVGVSQVQSSNLVVLTLLITVHGHKSRHQVLFLVCPVLSINRLKCTLTEQHRYKEGVGRHDKANQDTLQEFGTEMSDVPPSPQSQPLVHCV